MNLRGFTLIELLVSISIGVLLIALATESLFQVQRTVDRNHALLGLHHEAAAICHVLGNALESVQHTAALHLEVEPGVNGIAGDSDDRLMLTFLTALSSPTEESYQYLNDHTTDLVWTRLTWSATGISGRPTLGFSRGIGRRAVGTPTAILYAQPRRDRRRDLDDNDLRFALGADPTIYAAYAALGDARELDARLRPLHGPRLAVVDLSVGWLDAAGHSVSCTVTDGIVRRAADGSITPPLGTTWDTARRLSLDGVFLDGREHRLAPDPATVASRRPVLMRLAFTLTDDPTPADSTDQRRYVRQRFVASFPCSPWEALP